MDVLLKGHTYTEHSGFIYSYIVKNEIHMNISKDYQASQLASWCEREENPIMLAFIDLSFIHDAKYNNDKGAC